MSIPADFRQIIAQGDPDCGPGGCPSFTIVYGDDRLQCLKCFTEKEMRRIDAEIAELQRSSPERRFLQYFFQTRSVRVSLDPTGRLVLSNSLKEKVNHEEQVWFAGTGDSFEIWGSDTYRQKQGDLESMFREGDAAKDPMSLLDDPF